MNEQIFECDKGWHKEYHIGHLPPEAQKVATIIRDYLEEKTFGLNSCASGCPLFHRTFSYPYSRGRGDDITYHEREVKGLLHLVFDGGVLYDLLSPEGDGYYLGTDLISPLDELLEGESYWMECTTNYCFTIRRDD